MELNRQMVLLVALGVLALALVFLSWVLQMPSSPLAPVLAKPPAEGIVQANVIATPTPSPTASVKPFSSTTASPLMDDPCAGLPAELMNECLSASKQTVSPLPSDPCSGLPEELKKECLSAESKPLGLVVSTGACDGLPPELKTECLAG
ncbi:MAG: hypothetical protein V1717_00480 [Candidatus Micrarchaeota archaeon]